MEKKKALFPIIVILEILILCFGTYLSVGTTTMAVSYDKKYTIYYSFTVLGILMIAGLIILLAKKYRFTFLIGILCIAVYLFGAGFGAMVCTMNMQRMRRLENFNGKEIVATVDGVDYKWDGESVSYEGHKMTYLAKDEADQVFVDGEEKDFILCTGEKEQTVYICIYSGATGDYLELEAVRQ